VSEIRVGHPVDPVDHVPYQVVPLSRLIIKQALLRLINLVSYLKIDFPTYEEK
jgi:hypothetical protein